MGEMPGGLKQLRLNQEIEVQRDGSVRVTNWVNGTPQATIYPPNDPRAQMTVECLGPLGARLRHDDPNPPDESLLKITKIDHETRTVTYGRGDE